MRGDMIPLPGAFGTNTFVNQINVLRSYHAIKITLLHDDLFFNGKSMDAMEDIYIILLKRFRFVDK